MSNLTKYKPLVVCGCQDLYEATMCACVDGEFVKFDDVKEAITSCIDRYLVAINQPICKVELSDFIKELRQLIAVQQHTNY
jgi:hypothetical protein